MATTLTTSYKRMQMKPTRKSDTLTLLLGWSAVAWSIFLIDSVFCGGTLNKSFGVAPRSFSHLIGIVAMPFLHGSLAHLTGNTIVFVVLGGLVAWSRRQSFNMISVSIIILNGIGVWLFARGGSIDGIPIVHIGASGLLFGYIGYLVTEIATLRERNIVIGVIAVVMFTTMFADMFPGSRGISWEGHLFGCLAGVATSFLLAKKK